MADADNDLATYLAFSVQLRRTSGMILGSAYEYNSIEEFVLRNGAPFDAAPKPGKYGWGLPRSCYQNTYKLVRRHKNLVYIEGYAIGVIPVLHAWAVEIGSSRVIDITWKEPGAAYFGVPFARDYLLAHHRQAKKNDSGCNLLDNWQAGWPLLKGNEKGWKYDQAKRGGGQGEQEATSSDLR